MNQDCMPIENLVELITLDPDDPRRAHLDACPRCRARLAAFRSFLEMHPLPEGARPADARKRLSRAIRQETSISQRSRSRPGPWSFLEILRRPRWQAAAGLVVATGAVVLLLQLTERREEQPILLRGAEGTESVEGSVPAHSVQADGAVELRWPSMADADEYQILIAGLDLEEILRVEAGPETQILLAAETVRDLGRPGSVVFWRVSALRGGDRIALSPPATLTLPGEP